MMVSVINTIWEWFGAWIIDWGAIKSIISMLGDACLFFIAVYTFRLTVLPKKLKFIDYKCSMDAFHGGSFEIVLENRSLCPVVIKNVDLIINSHRINVSSVKEGGGCIVEGFKTVTLKSEQYTTIFSQNSHEMISLREFSKISLWVETSRGFQHIHFNKVSKILYSYKQKKISAYEPTMVCRNVYNEEVISRFVKYVLMFVDKSEKLNTVLILESGMMNKTLFGGNKLPDELMENEEELKNYLDSKFTECDLSYTLQKVDGWQVDKKIPLNKE